MDDEPRKVDLKDELRKLIAYARTTCSQYSKPVRVYLMARWTYGFTKGFVRGFFRATVISFIKGSAEGFTKGVEEARECKARRKQDRQGR